MNKLLLVVLLTVSFQLSNAQSFDSTKAKGMMQIFERITQAASNYKPDTSNVPDDKLTKKIIELRSLRGGFNINEAIAFKLEESRQKGELSPDMYKAMFNYFVEGNGKRLLDNATIHIYRDRFTYKELKQIVKFSKTSGGQKMAQDFPIIMVQSLSAAEMLKVIFQKQMNEESKHLQGAKSF